MIMRVMFKCVLERGDMYVILVGIIHAWSKDNYEKMYNSNIILNNMNCIIFAFLVTVNF